MKSINFREKLALFDDPWAPRVIADLNDYQFKLVKVQGDFVTHRHDDTDEAFIVLEGRLTIAFPDRSEEIGPGEMIVVPRGIDHRPSAEEPCALLLVEPRGVVNTGDAGGPRTAANDVRI